MLATYHKLYDQPEFLLPCFLHNCLSLFNLCSTFYKQAFTTCLACLSHLLLEPFDLLSSTLMSFLCLACLSSALQSTMTPTPLSANAVHYLSCMFLAPSSHIFQPHFYSYTFLHLCIYPYTIASLSCMFVCYNFILHLSPLCLLTCLTPVSCMFILHFMKNLTPTLLLVLHACCSCLESLKKKSPLCECSSCIFANNTVTCLASFAHLCLICLNLMCIHVSHTLLLNVCLAPYKAHALHLYFPFST